MPFGKLFNTIHSIFSSSLPSSSQSPPNCVSVPAPKVAATTAVWIEEDDNEKNHTKNKNNSLLSPSRSEIRSTHDNDVDDDKSDILSDDDSWACVKKAEWICKGKGESFRDVLLRGMKREMEREEELLKVRSKQKRRSSDPVFRPHVPVPPRFAIGSLQLFKKRSMSAGEEDRGFAYETDTYIHDGIYPEDLPYTYDDLIWDSIVYKGECVSRKKIKSLAKGKRGGVNSKEKMRKGGSGNGSGTTNHVPEKAHKPSKDKSRMIKHTLNKSLGTGE